MANLSNTKAKKSLKNIMLSAITQIIIMSLGLILPRFLLTTFGSEVNGLLNSVNQVYTYMQLLRAGIGMAAIQALYKPIINNDETTISDILSSSKHYFRRAGIVYMAGVFIIAAIFTLFGKVNLPWYYVFLIALLQGISGWLSFTFIGFFSDFLTAEGKNYVILSVQTVGHIFVQAAKIVVLLTFKNIIIMQAISIAISGIEILAYSIYRKKCYPWLKLNKKPKMELLANRNSYLLFHVTGLICTSTDTILLSMFCGFNIASVYSIYYLVISAVNAILNTLYSSTSFLIGQTYQEGPEKFTKMHDGYYLLYVTIAAALYTVCNILFLPFVSIYTKGITDTNYIFTYLPYLFCVAQILTCSKNVGEHTTNVGGYAKKVVPRAIAEASINFLLTIVLIQFIGIYGALIGTVVALSYRTIDSICFTNKYVLKRKPYQTLKVLGTNILLFLFISYFLLKVDLHITNYGNFFIKALIITPIIFIVFILVNIILNFKKFKQVKMIFNKFKKH